MSDVTPVESSLVELVETVPLVELVETPVSTRSISGGWKETDR